MSKFWDLTIQKDKRTIAWTEIRTESHWKDPSTSVNWKTNGKNKKNWEEKLLEDAKKD